MLPTLNKKYPFNDDLKINLKSFTGIGLGIFLFLLFFQPFALNNPDFENKLLIIAGFGVIALLLLGIIRFLIPSFFPKAFEVQRWTYWKELIINLVFLILNSTAFAFYARYVGQIRITFHSVIILIIITVSAMVVVIIINEFNRMKNQIKQLNVLTEPDQTVVSEQEDDVEIEFVSENQSDYFQVFLEQIMLIKSANNYIEVIYKSADKVSRRLIRNTIKNTEEHFSKYPSLVRCHRSCIVNKNYIQKLLKRSDGLKLVLFDYPQEIHVSRQYALKIKEAMKPAS